MKYYLMPPINRLVEDHTITIYTSAAGSAGSKVSVHKSLLLSALTVKMDKSLAGTDTTNGHWSQADNSQQKPKWFRRGCYCQILIS